MTDDEIIDALTDALEIIANGGNAVHLRWMTTGPKTREQMAEIAQSALLAVVSAAGESFVKDQAHRERIEKGE